jgi:hypothetical protein
MAAQQNLKATEMREAEVILDMKVKVRRDLSII